MEAEPVVKAGYMTEAAFMAHTTDYRLSQEELGSIQEEAESLEPGFGEHIIQQALPLVNHEREKYVDFFVVGQIVTCSLI